MKVEFAHEVVKPPKLPLVIGGVYVARDSVVIIATDVDPDEVDSDSFYFLISLSDGDVLMGSCWSLAEEVLAFLRETGYRYVPDAKVFIPAEVEE